MNKKNNVSEVIKERLFGTLVTIFTMLLSFLAYSFVSSLASKSMVEVYKKENDLKNIEIRKEVKRIHRALCFIDKRTCKFFEHGE